MIGFVSGMVDYSKWKNIEVSDDEDDTHPNIDTPSLFKWRHEARVQRMHEHQLEKQKLTDDKIKHKKRLEDAQTQLRKAKQQGLNDYTEMEKKLSEIAKEGEDIKERSAQMEKKEKLQPWNVDTISTPGFSKTVINKPVARDDCDQLSEEERETQLRDFIKLHEKQIKEYGMLNKFDDSKRYLSEHMELVCDHTANYLVIWAINLEMEEKHSLMEHVAHQCICMNYLLELAKQLNVHPKSCVSSFFARIQVADEDYKKAFYDEIDAFKQRIRKRAKEKVAEAVREYEEEERQKRLGPGNLDPAEVFESLPEALQKCFESRDTEMLKATIAGMDEEEARYHMKRCVDSGLWVANAADAAADDAQSAENDVNDEDPVYDKANIGVD